MLDFFCYAVVKQLSAELISKWYSLPFYWFRIRLRIRNSGFGKKIRNYLRIHNYSEIDIPNFRIILISLRVEVAQISDFLVHAKTFPLWKAFFNVNLYHPLHWARKTLLLFFLYLTSHGLFWSTGSISTNCWGTLYFEYFLGNVIKV